MDLSYLTPKHPIWVKKSMGGVLGLQKIHFEFSFFYTFFRFGLKSSKVKMAISRKPLDIWQNPFAGLVLWSVPAIQMIWGNIWGGHFLGLSDSYKICLLKVEWINWHQMKIQNFSVNVRLRYSTSVLISGRNSFMYNCFYIFKLAHIFYINVPLVEFDILKFFQYKQQNNKSM